MTILKRLREAAGVSREEFARLTGVTLARLEKHEQGRHGISLEDAATYATHLASRLSKTPSNLLAELAEIPQRTSALLPPNSPTTSQEDVA